MHGKAIFSVCLLASAFILPPSAEACTNVIVTRGASADGSVLVSYAADSHTLYGELYYAPARDWKEGSTRKIFDWDSQRYLGEIEQVPHTYQRVGNMNEHQLLIAESTFGGRSELMDKKGSIDYGSMIYIALERCRTAREAIRLMTGLANEYGYYSSGESFTIADKNEVWVMEVIGKGTLMKNGRNLNKGIVWVAVKVPDGYICAHANQSRISTFPLHDPENCLYSEDVIDFAREKGYFEGEDDEFSFCDAYAPLDFGAMRGCEARVWSAFNILSNGWFSFEDENGRLVTKDSYEFIDYAMGYDKSKRIPLFIQPAKKLTVKDIADVMRDHYEGTPMDMRHDIGAGGNALPYRWRPMEFQHEGKTFMNERAIATQQTGFWFVGQCRKDFPDVIGGILWFGTDDAATSYITPVYSNTTRIPECFRVGNGDILTYSKTSSFWMNNRVANSCYRMYDHMEPYVREKIDAFEKEQLRLVHENDNKALDLYRAAAERGMKKAAKKGDSYNPKEDTGNTFASVKRLLTRYSVNTAQTQFRNWVELEQTLLVKFIDGNIKTQDEKGKFVHSEYTVHAPDHVEQPGYTDFWKEAVARFHGDVIEVVED